MANVTEGVGRLHHLLGVSVYGEISLHHGVELLSQDNCEGGLVRREQSRNGDVEVACRLIWLHGEVEDAIVDAALHPAPDVGVRLRPITVSGPGWDGAAHGSEEGGPLCEVRQLEVEDDRDVRFHVDGSVGEDRGGRSIPQGWHGRGASQTEVEDALDESVPMAMDGAVANRHGVWPERAVRARRARSAAPWEERAAEDRNPNLPRM